MNYLIDGNVLVAWGWSDHVDHLRATSWIAEQKQHGQTPLYTSAIPQIGFIRVSVQRSAHRVSVSEATEVLGGMLESLGAMHRFLPDDQDATGWPQWCHSAARTTDAHLFLLAQRHGMQLATIDAEIPGAFLLPDRF
jgi:uncharacterized protein